MEDIIKQEYQIEVNKIEKSKTSTDGNVYIINSDEYVLKIYQEIDHTKMMVKLHEFLYENNFYVPQVKKNREKMLYTKIDQNQTIVLYSFLKGKKIKEISKESFPEVTRKIAIELKKIHDITGGENIFNLKDTPIKSNIKTKRYSALHFDLTKDNIFYNNEIQKVGFIDFDDAKYGESIIDVSIACVLLFISKKQGIDIENLKIFINNYYKDNEILKQKEIPFIKDIAIRWIDYVTNENVFDTSTKESFEIKKKLIENTYF